ncbi:YebO family protein [Escherichia coli]
MNISSLVVWWSFFLSGSCWFFLDRASSRTNEPLNCLRRCWISKTSNALLRRLCEANEPESR